MSRGRGRGRGKGISRSGLLEAISLPAGERLPPPILKPPPLYPPLERRPLEMKMTEEEKRLVALKQEIRQYMTDSPFFVTGRDKTGKNTVVPASYGVLCSDSGGVDDRVGKERGCQQVFRGWFPDWRLFPAELKPDLSKKKHKSTQPPPAKKRKLDLSKQGFSQALAGESETVVQSKQEQVGEEDKLEEEAEDNEEEEVVEYDEEEEEEEGDYTANYFDDGGEDYGGDEDDALEEKEGPCY